MCNINFGGMVVKNLLTPGEAAKELGVSRMTFWRWCKKGKIKPKCIGGLKFYSHSDVLKLKK